MASLKKCIAMIVSLLLFVNISFALGGITVFAAPAKILELDMSAQGNILTDLSGNGFNATVVSNETPPAGVFRKSINSDLTYGSAYSREFIWRTNGSSLSYTYAMIGNLTDGTPLMNYFNGDITVEMWVNIPADGGNNILSCNSNDFKINASKKGTDFQLYFYRNFTEGGGSWITSSAVITPDTWTHVALTYSPSDVNNKPVVYINGVSVAVAANVAAKGTAKSLNAPIIIGNQYDTGGASWQWTRPFKGQIASLKAYSGIATANEAKAYYDEGKGNFGWAFDPQIFDANDVLVTQGNINNVPVDAGKIDVVLRTPTGYVVNEDTVNSNNITLINTQTGNMYSYSGLYEPMTKTYTMRGFGDLEYGTRYKLTIKNIKYTDNTLARQNEQVLYFTTKLGLTVDNIVFKNASGGTLNSLQNETYANVNYTVTSHYDNSQNVVLIAALFKGDELIDIKTDNSLITKGSSDNLSCILDWTKYGANSEYHISTYVCDTVSSIHVLAQYNYFK